MTVDYLLLMPRLQACITVFGLLLLLSACAPRSREQTAPQNPPQIEVEPAEARFSLERPPNIRGMLDGSEAPPPQEELEAELSNYGERWLFGGGIGRTAANVGTVVLFPPYALYLVGNAGLALAGYEPLYLTDALPEKPRGYVLDAYNGVTSVPGRMNALVAGREFQEDKAPNE